MDKAGKQSDGETDGWTVREIDSHTDGSMDRQTVE
jgi:hypothetical protein